MDALVVGLVVAGVVAVVAALWAVATYNGFVRLRNLVQEAWRQIDVELHRRYDLIPHLVETVKGYAAHERSVFDEVTRARAAVGSPGAGPARRAEQENALTAALGRLLAVAEAYPQLRAAEPYQRLQAELTNTEDRIAAGRRFYNANVRQLNTKTESFPANLIASVFAFRRAEYFEANDPAVRTSPVVTFTDPNAAGAYAPGGHRPVAAESTPGFGGQRGGFDPARDAGRPVDGAAPAAGATDGAWPAGAGAEDWPR
ncbi:LemA family protein [Georgenia yuyongxinii]